MTDDRDICERLEDPSYDGAIYMRQDAAKEIRALRAKVKEQEEWNSLRAMDIVTLGQEVGRLREALEKIAALDVPPSVMTRYRADEQSPKNDICPHLLAMSEDCPDCISDYARAARAEKEEK